MTGQETDPRVEAILREAPKRHVEPLTRRDRFAESALAACLVAVVAAMARGLDGPATSSPVLAGALLAVCVVAMRIRFTVGSCTMPPTQVVIVPMLLLLHPALVPVLLVAGGILSRLPDYVRGRVHPDHVVLTFGDAWCVVAPALVLAFSAPGEPGLGHWPIYLAAFAAQVVADDVGTALRLWLAHGVSPRLQMKLQAVGWVTDLALAPVGLAVALVATEETAAVALVVPLLGLLAALGREREQRIKHALQLSEAYRGSALLMGEMLEAEDSYTGGEHTKGVLVLALAVGEELGLDARDQRNLEFGALLHDIGKLRVPEEILNKPGKLTPAEWEVIKRHPEDGQAMLDRIGGVLTDVGVIVRGHHERWDGGGYPDGLVADATPLAARIICACDSYNAMTTDRPYRKAMDVEEAIAELRACSGTQFDPRVVEAVERVVRRDQPERLSTLLAAA